MLFKDILIKKHNLLKIIFTKSMNLAFKNQTHDGDLLLLCQNAGYYEDIKKLDNSDPYSMGPRLEGHAERTHYENIGIYVKQAHNLPYADYLESVKYNPINVIEIDKKTEIESISIQSEMYLYLKIWESDTFLKKMHQLACLINKEDYDWHFKIKTHENNNKDGKPKSYVIKQLIKKFESIIPELSASIDKCYNTQIRNALAHSQYTIIGRTIMLNNYDNTKKDSIVCIEFEKWTDIFHETLMLFSCYKQMVNEINEIYYNTSLRDNKSFQVRENRLHPNKETLYYLLYTRDHFKDWGYESGS